MKNNNTKKRRDCFFGIHADFHATGSCPIYDNISEDDIRKICETLKPDYFQLDSKGHPGWASYPSKMGNASPEIKNDGIATFRKITREMGILLVMHHSGLYDIKYCEEHPESCAIRADGTPIKGATRLNCDYIDKQLIPQLCELAEKYDIDAIWSDGDCWVAFTDFHPETLAAFEKDTGISLNGKLPATKNDPHYEEYREYHRELYRKWLRHYVDSIHDKCPNVDFTSNWSFSDHMPEEPSANLDYLSGDITWINSVNYARYCGRALAQNDIPWDIMSWAFRARMFNTTTRTPKAPAQLMQEAAATISMGGGYQWVIPQYPNGELRTEHFLSLKPVADFVRQRESCCFRVKPVHQAALLMSTHDRAIESTSRLYSRDGHAKLLGLTALLCDSGQSLEIVSEFKLKGHYNEYPMIVIPELYDGLKEETVKDLLNYVKEGGALMLVGKKTCNFFSKFDASFTTSDIRENLLHTSEMLEDGHDTDKKSTQLQPYYFTLDKLHYGTLVSPVQIISNEGNDIAWLSEEQRDEKTSFAKIIPFGKGKIAAIGCDIGSQYLNGTQYLHRTLIKSAADELYEPKVRLEHATGILEIVCSTKNDKLFVQLVNANGNHTNPNSATENFIPPALDITLSIALDNSPRALLLQPEGRELTFEYKDGRAYVEVERINIHNVIEVVM
ncbi:MAG: alpha-L-fucosidase [Clostridia bacterium]|nr:alpha-L-fucosidase [Clostridia bacterium]